MPARNLLDRLRSPAEVRAVVPAAPAAVFAVISDPETYPEWLAGAQNATISNGNGTDAHSADPPTRLVLDVHAGPLKGVVEFELEPTVDGTLVTFRERAIGSLENAMPLLRAPIFLRNKASLEKLRHRFMPLVVRL